MKNSDRQALAASLRRAADVGRRLQEADAPEPTEQEQQVLELCRSVLGLIDGEVRFWRSNPNHVASGEHGGEFASDGMTGELEGVE
jgi:hypothetical protein